ncbi:MAG: CDP-alcohol phosphatidyltransferase family protein [Bacilli bacterium]|nr:CDP-alcohol phosphatidyltransferase family protein [Bacilli bacterium]
MKEEIKKYWKEFKTGTKTMFKEFFKKETNKKQRANMWTFSRFIIPIISFITSLIALSTASIPLFIGSGVIAGMGAVTDFFDGRSARKHGSTSNYGKLLDQVTDKYFAGVVGINLLFLNPNYIYILIGELAIALINIGYKLKHKDLNISSTQIGRFKEWPLFLTLGLGFLAPINSVMLLLSNIGVMLTLVFQTATAVSYIDENNKNIKIQNRIELNTFIEKLEEEKDKDLENEKTKSIEPKSISRLEQCENLRKLKEELIGKEEDKTIEEKGFQKRKK